MLFTNKEYCCVGFSVVCTKDARAAVQEFWQVLPNLKNKQAIGRVLLLFNICTVDCVMWDGEQMQYCVGCMKIFLSDRCMTGRSQG
jgi:hypothetical protein